MSQTDHKTRRIELNERLVSLLGSGNVYFQPPENIKIKYPCIIYDKVNENVIYADNVGYRKKNAYDVTVISRDPDFDLSNGLYSLGNCSYNRGFKSDNLYHHVYRLYF